MILLHGPPVVLPGRRSPVRLPAPGQNRPVRSRYDPSAPQDPLPLVQDKGLPRCDRGLRMIEYESNTIPGQDLEVALCSGVTISDLGLCTGLLITRLPCNPYHVLGLHIAAQEILPAAHHYLVQPGMKCQHVVRAARSHPKATPLSDRVTMGPFVHSELSPVSIDDISGAFDLLPFS